MTWWGALWGARRLKAEPDVGQGLSDLQQEVRRVARQLLLAEARWEAMERALADTRAGIQALRDHPEPQEASGPGDGRVQLALAVIEGLDGLEQAATSLARAGQDSQGPADRAATLDALGRVHRHIVRALLQAGVERVPSEGAAFDPRVHRAVARVPAPGRAGQVVAVDRPGYRMDGAVLRFAEVLVGAEPGEGPQRAAGPGPETAGAPRDPSDGHARD